MNHHSSFTTSMELVHFFFEIINQNIFGKLTQFFFNFKNGKYLILIKPPRFLPAQISSSFSLDILFKQFRPLWAFVALCKVQTTKVMFESWKKEVFGLSSLVGYFFPRWRNISPTKILPKLTLPGRLTWLGCVWVRMRLCVARFFYYFFGWRRWRSLGRFFSHVFFLLGNVGSLKELGITSLEQIAFCLNDGEGFARVKKIESILELLKSSNSLNCTDIY